MHTQPCEATMSLSNRCCAFAAAAAVAGAATAGGAAQPAPPPDPALAAAPVAPLIYAPVFAGYRPLGEDKTTSWREANDQAAHFGGWRAYAREARQPEPPASAAAGTPADRSTR